MHHDTFTPQFVQAVLAAIPVCRAKFPGEDARIHRGALLVVDGAVTTTCHETSVASGTTDGKKYLVNTHCGCEDATRRAPGGRCKHMFAKWLMHRALRTSFSLGLTPAQAEAWRTQHTEALRDARAAAGEMVAQAAQGSTWEGRLQ